MAQKVKKTTKTARTSSTAKTTKAKRAAADTKTRRKTTAAKSSANSAKTTKRTAPKPKKSAPKRAASVKSRQKKTAVRSKPVSVVPEPTPGLVRQTKSSAAALKHLEKAIELIFKKDFKKALVELRSLCNSYPGETEILARARSYIIICEREDAPPKKSAESADQLYALGVLEHNKAHYDKAISYYQESLKNNPESDYIYYSIAASHAMKGDLADSLDHLRKAIDLNEDSRIYARNDDDFSVFEENEEFAELVGLAQNQDTDLQ